MSRLTESQKEEIRYNIYEQLFLDERASLTSMSRKLGLARNTVTSHYNYMIENEILFPPSMRLKMFDDLREYVYFLTFEKPMRIFQGLETHPHVVYQCLMSGAFDLVVIADTLLDFGVYPGLKRCILGGPRGDYLFTRVSRTTYKKAFNDIKTTVLEAELEPSELDMEFPSREIVWTNLEWRLFYDLKYDMRRTFTQIVKKHKVSKWLFYQAYERVKKNCVITIPFYPKGASSYFPFYITLKTEYEHLLSDIFLKIPCIGAVFKVEDRLAAWINIVRTFPYNEFFGFLNWMKDRNIIEDLMYAFPIYFERRD